MDVILTWSKNFGVQNLLSLSYAGNFNQMKLDNITTSPRLAGKEEIYFGRREQHFLLASAPPSKMNLIADYKFRNWNPNLKLIRFGEVTLIDWLGNEDIYRAKLTTDLALSHKLTQNINLTVGGVNIFDVYPTEQDTETEAGGLWDPVQMGFNGAYYYTRLRFTF